MWMLDVFTIQNCFVHTVPFSKSIHFGHYPALRCWDETSFRLCDPIESTFCFPQCEWIRTQTAITSSFHHIFLPVQWIQSVALSCVLTVCYHQLCVVSPQSHTGQAGLISLFEVYLCYCGWSTEGSAVLRPEQSVRFTTLELWAFLSRQNIFLWNWLWAGEVWLMHSTTFLCLRPSTFPIQSKWRIVAQASILLAGHGVSPLSSASFSTLLHFGCLIGHFHSSWPMLSLKWPQCVTDEVEISGSAPLLRLQLACRRVMILGWTSCIIDWIIGSLYDHMGHSQCNLERQFGA